MLTSITINEDAISAEMLEHSVNENDISEENDTCCKNGESSSKVKRSIQQGDTPAYKAINPNSESNSYADNKNTAEGLMDIALLSANANQLRFLITYNHDASTYYISIALVALSLIMQVLVGIALIFKRRFYKCRNKRYNEIILGGVFIITVVNILLAAFTTTDAK